MESFGLQADGAHDKSRKPQEATNIESLMSLLENLASKPWVSQSFAIKMPPHVDPPYLSNWNTMGYLNKMHARKWLLSLLMGQQ